MIRWLSRSLGNHDTRVVVLVDSLVTIGAYSKGRSSAFGVNRIIQQIVATALGAGLVLRLIYTGTEWNLADYPSRGRRLPPSLWQRLQRQENQLERAARWWRIQH